MREVSEIDKYIKSSVLSSAFKLILDLDDDDDDDNDVGHEFTKLYPLTVKKGKKDKWAKYHVLDKIRQTFEGLAGTKDPSHLNLS